MGWMYIATRVSGPFFVGGGTALITLVVFMYFVEILPSLLPPYESYLTYLTQPHVIIDIVLSFYIAFNIYFNYYKTITVDPGSPSFPSTSSLDDISSSSSTFDVMNSSSDTISSSSLSDSSNSINNNNNNATELPLVIDFNIPWAYCKKCSRPKPPRCHHCNVCNKCVLKMDHHCPWMANCIGYKNYRYFLLTLFYLEIGCLFVVFHSLLLFYGGEQSMFLDDKYDEITRFLIITSFILAALLALVMGGFMAFHIYLLSTGQTTIENLESSSHSKSKKRNYNLGWRTNFEMVLGKGKYWFSGLLPTNRLPKGDGYYFMTREMYDDYLKRQNQFTSGIDVGITSSSSSNNSILFNRRNSSAMAMSTTTNNYNNDNNNRHSYVL